VNAYTILYLFAFGTAAFGLRSWARGEEKEKVVISGEKTF